MHGQRQFERHLKPVGVRHIARAAAKPVGHERTGVYVVCIVVGAVTGAVNGIWHARPLGIIPCAFQAARQAAHLAATPDVAHAAAETDGIGRNDTPA